MANEERQLDPNAYATKLDLAELKTEMLQIKSELEDKISGVRIAVAGLTAQMKWVFALQIATLAAVVGMLFKNVL